MRRFHAFSLMMLFAVLGCAEDNSICVSNCDENPEVSTTVAEVVPTPDNKDCKCAPDEVCSKGACVKACPDGKTYCDGNCVNLGALHLSSCNTCFPHYCDTDGDISNGCETSALGSDAQNCGDCGVRCDNGQLCDCGECMPACPAGKVNCDGACVDLTRLHLANCSVCSPDYCNVDNDWGNGCEVYAKGSHPEHCGACNHPCEDGLTCVEGTCQLVCDTGEALCNGECVYLDDLRLQDCNTCLPGYCNNDGNFENGCEVDSMGSDAENCGGCGIKCGSGQGCQNGVCYNIYETHRVMILTSGADLEVRAGAGSTYTQIGSLPNYTYVTALNKEQDWYLIDFGETQGWIYSGSTMYIDDSAEGRIAIDYAELFLYELEHKYCTYDHLTYPPIIQHFTNLYSYGATYNYGYNDNCANFVTAVLMTVELIKKKMTTVSAIRSYCQNGTEGYHFIDSFSEAKPGDIWMSDGHTELVVGPTNDGGALLIGSNNFTNKNFTGCVEQRSSEGKDYQRVSYAKKKAGDGKICSRQ